ncbi:MAG: hypothetical protein COA44_11210 [Arcobacter sp.]|nr:MAG: hypothetical protein COA44_11210 [Arcobacter sp.]
MKFIQTLCILWVSFFLLGCAPKTYKKNESRFILIKTPLLKYADLGYIRSNADELRADLFVVGTLVQSIEIATLICVNEGCLTKSAFNEDYLNASYPDDLLLNVLLGRPIFEKASFKVTDRGFRQELKGPEYNIIYKVEDGDISFKDSQNKLKIKILKTKG